MARAMSRGGDPAYLYLFTWADTGKRAKLGACHGEELDFLSDSFPSDWTEVDGQKRFGETLRHYWANFAKTGHPGSAGLPPWPAYSSRSIQVLQLGSRIQLAPASSDVRGLQKVMQPILENAGK